MIFTSFLLYFLLCFSDTPTIRPREVEYFPGEADLIRITGWMKYQMGAVISRYHPAYTKCGKFIRWVVTVEFLIEWTVLVPV